MKTLEDVYELLQEIVRNQEKILNRRQDTLLNAKEAAERLGIGRNTLYTWVRQGRLHRVLRDGKWGFDTNDIDVLMI